MNPSQFAATNILPLMARIVLCVAFLPQGWNNLMRDVEYTGKDAKRLRELGVRGVTDPAPTADADMALGAVRGWDARWEAFEARRQDAGTLSAADGATPASTTGAASGSGAAAPASGSVPAVAPAPAAATPVVPLAPSRSPLAPMGQRGLYTLALLADRAGLPFPVEVAWTTATVQLVGGAGILLGMFTRVWGFLMSFMMAALFVITALPGLRESGLFGMGAEQQNLVLAQLGLLVMALGTFLAGPGAMSLDRAIFRRPRHAATRSKGA